MNDEVKSERELVRLITEWGRRLRESKEKGITPDGQFKVLVEEACEELYDYDTAEEFADAIGDTCVTSIVQYDMAPQTGAVVSIEQVVIKREDERILDRPVVWVGRIGRELGKGTPDGVRYACAGLYQAAKRCAQGRFDFRKDCLTVVLEHLHEREKEGYVIRDGRAIKRGDL